MDEELGLFGAGLRRRRARQHERAAARLREGPARARRGALIAQRVSLSLAGACLEFRQAPFAYWARARLSSRAPALKLVRRTVTLRTVALRSAAAQDRG